MSKHINQTDSQKLSDLFAKSKEKWTDFWKTAEVKDIMKKNSIKSF